MKISINNCLFEDGMWIGLGLLLIDEVKKKEVMWSLMHVLFAGVALHD